MNNRGIQQFIQVARRLPPKYWVVLGALALVYFFAEPKLEAMLGQRLPGFNNNQTPLTAENDVRDFQGKADNRKQLDDIFEQNRQESNDDSSANGSAAAKPVATKAENSAAGKTSAGKTSTGKKNKPQPGELTEVGRRVFESTAGLIYTPGSREGHRIDHLMRHTKDQPNRQGSHGVFDGGREGMLAVIDEAYLLAIKGGRNVQTENQDGRTIYTVDLKRRVGFVGGQSGGRKNNPPVKRVRLVLDGKKVITAYPYR